MAAGSDTGPLLNGKRNTLLSTLVGVLLAAALAVAGWSLERAFSLAERVVVLEQHNLRAAELSERIKQLEDGRQQQREGLARVDERLKGIDEKLAAIQAALMDRRR